MDLAQETKLLLKKFGLKAKKNFSQNFLVDEHILYTIVKTAEINKDEKIIEIGPGLGLLSRALQAEGAEVFAIEQDRDMLSILRANFALEKNFHLLDGDALKILNDFKTYNLPAKNFAPQKLGGLPPTTYKLISNIPYSITGKLLRLLMDLENKPELMVLLLQKEVAERLTASSGELSILGVLSQMVWEIKIIKIVSKHCFFPAPKVDSAVVLFRPKNVKLTPALVRIIKIGFASRRQTLANNLTAGLGINKQKAEIILNEIGLKKLARAQELTIQNWQDLEQKIAKILYRNSENPGLPWG